MDTAYRTVSVKGVKEVRVFMEQGKSEFVDVAIIGGGPAGLTAALYVGRAQLSVKVIEEMAAGGQVFTTSVVENYPGVGVVDGPTIAQKMEEQARQWGAEIVFGHVYSISGSLGDGFTLNMGEGTDPILARTVIVASGSAPRKLGVPGEDEFRGRGVSYCATCDGAFFRDKRVIVVGGGDSALEEGLFLTRYASEVKIVHRRDQLRASKHFQERAERNEKVSFVWNSVVQEIKGGQTVEEVVIKDVKTGETRSLPADGVFIYIGMLPNTQFLKGFVELDEQGFVKAGEDCRTSVPGVLAAGDVRVKPLRQIVTAVADGAVAAMQAEHFLASRR